MLTIAFAYSDLHPQDTTGDRDWKGKRKREGKKQIGEGRETGVEGRQEGNNEMFLKQETGEARKRVNPMSDYKAVCILFD